MGRFAGGMDPNVLALLQQQGGGGGIGGQLMPGPDGHYGPGGYGGVQSPAPGWTNGGEANQSWGNDVLPRPMPPQQPRGGAQDLSGVQTRNGQQGIVGRGGNFQPLGAAAQGRAPGVTLNTGSGPIMSPPNPMGTIGGGAGAGSGPMGSPPNPMSGMGPGAPLGGPGAPMSATGLPMQDTAPQSFMPGGSNGQVDPRISSVIDSIRNSPIGTMGPGSPMTTTAPAPTPVPVTRPAVRTMVPPQGGGVQPPQDQTGTASRPTRQPPLPAPPQMGGVNSTGSATQDTVAKPQKPMGGFGPPPPPSGPIWANMPGGDAGDKGGAMNPAIQTKPQVPGAGPSTQGPAFDDMMARLRRAGGMSASAQLRRQYGA